MGLLDDLLGQLAGAAAAPAAMGDGDPAAMAATLVALAGMVI